MFKPGFLFSLFVLLMPAVVGAQDAFIQPKGENGPLVHRASGFSFPARIDNFHRVSPHQFDEAGEDVSVGYNLEDPGIAVTIFVYPASAGDLDAEFARRQRELTDRHTTAQLVGQGSVSVSPKKVRALGAEYSYSEEFAGEVQPLRSILLVALRGKQFVEYRISYRAAAEAESHKLAVQLTQDFAWP